MRILIINGPNLNMLGYREPDMYGKATYNDLCEYIRTKCSALNIEAEIVQHNSEGAIIDTIQDAFFNIFGGVIINAGAYTHYSYAIRDALAILKCPIAEVHLTDIDNREDFRKVSVISDVVSARFYGKGFDSYGEAIAFLSAQQKKC